MCIRLPFIDIGTNNVKDQFCYTPWDQSQDVISNTAIYNFLFTFPFFFSLIFGSNLDETTRSVYKENVRLNAALDFHLREGQELKKVCLLRHCNVFFAENSNHCSLLFCTIYPPFKSWHKIMLYIKADENYVKLVNEK